MNDLLSLLFVPAVAITIGLIGYFGLGRMRPAALAPVSKQSLRHPAQ